MPKSEPRNYITEMKFVKSVMHDHRGSLVVGYVPYGHIIHIWNRRTPRWPFCGTEAGGLFSGSNRNRKRSIEWGDGICRRCLRLLERKDQ